MSPAVRARSEKCPYQTKYCFLTCYREEAELQYTAVNQCGDKGLY